MNTLAQATQLKKPSLLVLTLCLSKAAVIAMTHRLQMACVFYLKP